MKNLLFLKALPAFPIQGADISVYERISLLAEYGWAGKVISTGQAERQGSFEDILNSLGIAYSYDASSNRLIYSYAGVEGQLWLGSRADAFVAKNLSDVNLIFDRAVSYEQPSVLLGNVRDPFVLKYLAGRTDMRTLMFLTEDEYPKRGEAGSEEFFKALLRIDKLIVGSEYLQNSLRAQYEIESLVLTNTIDLALYTFQKTSPPAFITLMHPYAHKGVEFFLELVEQMPDRQFLVVAGLGQEYRKLKPRLLSYKNLTLVPFTKDLKSIYAKTRILLVPSMWQEAFSRVIIEAFCSHTPVISSGTGGMRQTGGDAAIYRPVEREFKDSGKLNVTTWIQEISRLDNQDYYAEIQGKISLRMNEYRRDLADALSKLSSVLSGTDS